MNIVLNRIDLSTILVAIPEHATQARNLIRYLNQHPNATAEDIGRHCSIANVSDVARKINPLLLEHGLFIACSVPVAPRQFHYGNKPRQYQWAIHLLPIEAANDETYRQQKAL